MHRRQCNVQCRHELNGFIVASFSLTMAAVGLALFATLAYFMKKRSIRRQGVPDLFTFSG